MGESAAHAAVPLRSGWPIGGCTSHLAPSLTLPRAGAQGRETCSLYSTLRNAIRRTNACLGRLFILEIGFVNTLDHVALHFANAYVMVNH